MALTGSIQTVTNNFYENQTVTATIGGNINNAGAWNSSWWVTNGLGTNASGVTIANAAPVTVTNVPINGYGPYLIPDTWQQNGVILPAPDLMREWLLKRVEELEDELRRAKSPKEIDLPAEESSKYSRKFRNLES